MTAPAMAPEQVSAEHEDEDDVHIRCMVCRHVPITSVCGAVLKESEERKDPAEMNCARCAELWPVHVKSLHPVSRARSSRCA